MDPSAEHDFFERSVPLSEHPVSLDVQPKREAIDFESREARRTYFIRVVASIIGALSVACAFAFTRAAQPLAEPLSATATLGPPAALAVTLPAPTSPEGAPVPPPSATLGAPPPSPEAPSVSAPRAVSAPPVVPNAVRSARHSVVIGSLVKPGPGHAPSSSTVPRLPLASAVTRAQSTARFPD